MNKIPMVVLNYNDFQTTSKCIESFKEKIADMVQLIIVDNASNNGSYEKLVEKYSDCCTIIRCNDNRGYAAGNNFGLRYVDENNLAVDGKVIVSNPDVIIEAKAISNMCSLMDREKQAKICSARMLDADGNYASSTWKLPSFSRETFSCLFFINRLFKLDKNVYNESSDDEYKFVDAVNGSFFIADFEVFKEVGFFDEDTFLYCEENILAKKLKDKNYAEMLSVNDSYIHNHNSTIGKVYSKRIDRYMLLVKSKEVYLRKSLNVSKMAMWFYKLISAIGLFERKMAGLFIKSK